MNFIFLSILFDEFIFRIKSDLTGLYFLQSNCDDVQKNIPTNEILNIPEMISVLIYVNL